MHKDKKLLPPSSERASDQRERPCIASLKDLPLWASSSNARWLGLQSEVKHQRTTWNRFENQLLTSCSVRARNSAQISITSSERLAKEITRRIFPFLASLEPRVIGPASAPDWPRESRAWLYRSGLPLRNPDLTSLRCSGCPPPILIPPMLSRFIFTFYV